MINIGIYGYGNLAKGVLKAVKKNSDFNVVGIFSRRDPKKLKEENKEVNFYSVDEVLSFKDKIDVMIMCGGSKSDLPQQSPLIVSNFNIVDSFDTHQMITEHFDNVNKNALASKHVGIISVGWDPGMFSLNRIIFDSILPDGNTYTFWGKGVSQGHSDAIRRIDGVLDARQYTIPIDSTLGEVRSGNGKKYSAREMHKRECYVVAKEGADKGRIEQEIKTMPYYFADYDTTVHFITKEELDKNHSGIPHGGFVIRSGETSEGVNHVLEYRLKLDSNPEFTASILVAYARACVKMYKRGEYGCKTVFDVAPKDLSNLDYQNLIAHKL